MKKKNLIIFIIIIIILVIFFILSNREISIKESTLKKIFTLNNYENVEIFFIDIVGNKHESIDNKDKKILFLNSIKDERIKPIFENPDKTNSNEAYRMLIEYNNKQYRLLIFSNNTLVINKKRYSTKNNLYEPVSSIFDNGSL